MLNASKEQLKLSELEKNEYVKKLQKFDNYLFV